MARKIIAVLALLLVALGGLVIYASTRPDTFRVTRSAAIKAPPEAIFAVLNDFHRWESWSPWEKMDPSMKRTFRGESIGQGSIYEWEGNRDVGAGRMEITGSVPSSKITVKLDFLKPFEAHNVVEFSLESRGGTTNVTWTMYGPSPLVSKIMDLFFNMDAVIGRDFERGLGNLKDLAEKQGNRVH